MLLERSDLTIKPGSEDAFAEAMAAAAKGLRAAGNQPALLLQPGWDSQSGQALATAHVLRHPQWRLSLQSHKWLGLR